MLFVEIILLVQKRIKIAPNLNKQNNIFVLGFLFIALLTDEIINLYQVAKNSFQVLQK